MSQSLSNPLTLPATSRALGDLVERVAPSVVQVHGRPRRPASGIVIAPERVVTTSHSVERTEGVTVRDHGGQVHAAGIAGHAPGADVVLLRVPGLVAPALVFGEALVRPGELAIVVGRTWRGTAHVRLSAVSSLGGPIAGPDGTTIDQVVGLPVGAYPGVSGSAVLDAAGHLAALATAGLLQGRVLGLPAEALRGIVATLEERGSVTRGYLGISTQPVRLARGQAASAAQEAGLVVVAVAENSPADDTLLVGDVLVRAGDHEVAAPEDLLALLGPERVGGLLPLRVLRGDVVSEVAVRVGARPSRW